MAEFTVDPLSYCSAGPINDNLHNWISTIIGPPGLPFLFLYLLLITLKFYNFVVFVKALYLILKSLILSFNQSTILFITFFQKLILILARLITKHIRYEKNNGEDTQEVYNHIKRRLSQIM